MSNDNEELRYRRQIEDFGFSMIYHVLTLDAALSDAAYRLYGLIIKYAQTRNRAWPGVTRMAHDLGKGERSISRALQELEGRGIISRQRRWGTSSITWIEDLNDIYQEQLEQVCESAKNGRTEDIDSAKNGRTEDIDSAKNGRTILPNLADKEELEKKKETESDGKEQDFCPWSVVCDELLLIYSKQPETIRRLHELRLVEYQDSTIILSASEDTKAWIESRLKQEIQHLLIGITGTPIKLEITT